MTMPQTRHYEMKDSGVEWIGPMPSHWSAKRLKYVARSLAKGNGITKDETFVDGDTPCIRYGEIYTRYNQSFTECVTRTNKDIISSPRYFSHGDILFTCTGELVEEIGKSVAYLGSEECMAGGDIIVLKHTQNASFLNYALNCNYAQAQKSCDKAKLKVVHISAFDIGNIILAFPPLSEQTAIAAYLDEKCATIDAIISEAKASIEEYKSWKASVIFETVTKGLNPNAEMKDSGVEWIGRVSKGWKIVPAKFFMRVQAGYPFDSERFDNSQGIPLIRIRDITSGHTETFYNGDYPEEYVVHNNDLLVGMDGDFNVRWWQGGEAVLNQRCCRIFAQKGLILRYFYFLLPFYLKQVNELAYSTTVKHLANGDIGNADICLPPEEEQAAIAAYLDKKCAAIDGIILEKEDLIRELENYKRSLIFEVVTGKRRVC